MFFYNGFEFWENWPAFFSTFLTILAAIYIIVGIMFTIFKS